jgi:hypothetical protein
MVPKIELFESGYWSVFGFGLCGCMKSEFYEIKGETRAELLAGILAADKEA